MNFKTLIIFVATLLPLTTHAESLSLEASTVGVIVRPRLLERLSSGFSKSADKIHIDECLTSVLDLRLEGDIKIALSKPRWVSRDDDKIELKLQIDQLEFVGSLLQGCEEEVEKRKLISPVTGNLKQALTVSLTVTPTTGAAEIDNNSLTAAAKLLAIHMEKLSSTNEWLNVESVRKGLIPIIAVEAQNRLGTWISNRFRGFTYVEVLKNILNDRGLFGDGMKVQDGPFSLKAGSGTWNENELTFCFQPRTDSALIVNDRSAEMYFSAGFLSGAELKALYPNTNSSQERALSLQKSLQSASVWKEKTFRRPNFPEVDADFSLFFTEALVNQALETIYREDLGKFTMDLNLSEPFRGNLTRELVNLGIRMELASDQAPTLSFEANSLRLEVKDYFLNLGSFVKGRLIPNSSVRARASLRAELGVDPTTKSVNLRMDPTSFQLKLERGGPFPAELGERDFKMLENIATSWWVTFFKRYPELILFPNLIETAKANIRLLGFKVTNGFIIMHFDVDEESLKL